MEMVVRPPVTSKPITLVVENPALVSQTLRNTAFVIIREAPAIPGTPFRSVEMLFVLTKLNTAILQDLVTVTA